MKLRKSVLEECAREAGERNFCHGIKLYQLAVVTLQLAQQTGGGGVSAKQLAEAEDMIKDALEFIKKIAGEQSDWTFHSKNVLAHLRHLRGNYEAAIETRQELLRWQVEFFGETAPHAWLYRFQLHESLEAANLEAERMQLLDEVARLGMVQSQTAGPLPYHTTLFLILLSEQLVKVGRKDEARAILEGRAPHFRAETPGQRDDRKLLENLLNGLKGV